MTAATPAIAVHDLVKVFGSGSSSVTALDHVDLGINDNEFFTLLGPSGCGKTTLLRMIAGFEQPTSGRVEIFGDEVAGLPPFERSVNTVFQQYALFPHMTVAENVGFGLKMLGRDAAEITQAVDQSLQLVKMQEFAQRRPAQLSGGQQQRIALARALSPRPKVLLLDEPLSALDLKLRQAMRSELKNLQRETGITFVFVTHDQEEALTMSDRIAVMSAGRIQQIGAPHDIYERPLNRFVADFIGDSNFFDATIESIDGDHAVCRIGQQLTLATALVGNHATSDVVTLAVRPEKISLKPSATTASEFLIKDSIYLGTDTSYVVSDQQGVAFNVREQNSITGEARFSVGDAVDIDMSIDTVRMLAD